MSSTFYQTYGYIYLTTYVFVNSYRNTKSIGSYAQPAGTTSKGCIRDGS